jgi:hypothetical protein
VDRWEREREQRVELADLEIEERRNRERGPT